MARSLLLAGVSSGLLRGGPMKDGVELALDSKRVDVGACSTMRERRKGGRALMRI